MRFAWSEEQSLLGAELRKFLGDRYDFESRRKRVAGGFDAGMWQQLSELGLLGLPFDEQYGGSGGSALDTLVVMEAFGRHLVVEPYVPTVVLGGGLLRIAASEQQRQRYLPGLIAGELRFALAFAEQQSRFNLADVATVARRDADGYVLSGHKIVVYGAPEAQHIFVTARIDDGCADAGLSLFLIAADAAGVELRTYTTVDGMSAAEVVLHDVHTDAQSLVGAPHRALPAIEQVLDEAIAAICGEAVGAMAALNEKCVEYSKTRQAFGSAIADFQVIGHRLVDMHVAYEQAAAMAIKAALKVGAEPAERAKTISAAKVKVGQEGIFIGKHAVQLHGAIGTTDELDIGHYFKRLLAIQTLYGSTAHHLRRYVQLGDQRFARGDA